MSTPTSHVVPEAPDSSHHSALPIPTSSSLAALRVRVKREEGSPELVPALSSTVGRSDAELVSAALSLGNMSVIEELDKLLAKDKDEHFSQMLVDPARAYVKMWMSVSFG